MFTITWIEGRRLETISTPRIGTAFRVFMRSVKSGRATRIWRNGTLVL